MPSVNARLSALVAEIQRRQMEKGAPLDGLSRSLFDLQREFAALDSEGKTQLLETLNHPADSETDSLHLTTKELEQFLADYGRKEV